MRSIFLGGPLHLIECEMPECGWFVLKGARPQKYVYAPGTCHHGEVSVFILEGLGPAILADVWIRLTDIEWDLAMSEFPKCEIFAARGLLHAEEEFRRRIAAIEQNYPPRVERCGTSRNT